MSWKTRYEFKINNIVVLRDVSGHAIRTIPTSNKVDNKGDNGFDSRWLVHLSEDHNALQLQSISTHKYLRFFNSTVDAAGVGEEFTRFIIHRLNKDGVAALESEKYPGKYLASDQHNGVYQANKTSSSINFSFYISGSANSRVHKDIEEVHKNESETESKDDSLDNLLSRFKENIKTLEESDIKSGSPDVSHQKKLNELHDNLKSISNKIMNPDVQVSSPSTDVTQRKEIDSLPQQYTNDNVLKPGPELNRYLRCLRAIQTDDYLKTGYPQNGSTYAMIAGIHGFPGTLQYEILEGKKDEEQWETVYDKFSNNVETYYGCIHNKENFPEWHRPYLLVMERALQNAAKNDSDKKRYEEELEDFGPVYLPYWDWSRVDGNGKAFGMPRACLAPKAIIDGKQDNNPLYSFVMFDNHQNPSKQSYVAGGATRSSNDDFKNHCDVAKVHYEIYQALNVQLFHEYFSTDEFSAADALETIHDNIHVFAGGVMADVTWAAYDPIFFLHHCNVDRFLEAWYQKYFPEKVTSGVIENIKTHSTDPTILQTPVFHPFYGNLNDPRVYIGDPKNSLPEFFKMEDCINDANAFGFIYPEFDHTPVTHPRAVQFASDRAKGGARIITIEGLTTQVSMLIYVYILPFETTIEDPLTFDPEEKYFVKVVTIFGGKPSTCLNCLKHGHFTMKKNVDATKVMLDNNLSLRSKPFLVIINPRKRTRINPANYGITATVHKPLKN